MRYMSEEEARRAIVDVGRRVYGRGYVSANDGNISCRISEDTIVVTPTGVSKGYMTEEMMVKMHLDGSVDGSGKPSSEVKMHIRAYEENAEIGAVVHAHPPAATSYSIIGMELDTPLVAEAVLVTGNMPIARYAKPGTYAVPDSITPYIKEYNGALLENHGAITWGTDVYQALYRMEALEHQAKISMYSLLLSKLTGKPIRHFTKEELDGLVSIRNAMGIKTGGVPRT